MLRCSLTQQQWPLGILHFRSLILSKPSPAIFYTSKRMFHMKFQPQRLDLVGGWTNPFEKYANGFSSSSPNCGVKIKRYLSCQHPAMYMVLNFPALALFSTVPNCSSLESKNPPKMPRLLVDGNGKKYQMHLTLEKCRGKMVMDAQIKYRILRLFQHTFGTHPEQPLPTGYKGIPFIVG